MNAWFQHLAVLADQGRISELGSGFRGKGAELEWIDLVLWASGILGVLVSVWLLMKLLAWRDGRGARNSPRALFRRLGKAHGLDRGERRVLRQLARSQRLAHPGRVFLEPDRLEPARLPPQLAARRDTIAALRRRLFGAEAG